MELPLDMSPEQLKQMTQQQVEELIPLLRE